MQMRKSSSVVDVSDWRLLAKSEYRQTYPFGMLVRKKAIRIYEHGGQLYHFKPPHGLMMLFAKDAVWKDLITSQVGKMMGINVPQTWLALDDRLNESHRYGVLTKWFYALGAEVESGANILRRLIPHYQRRKHHNLETILEYARAAGIQNAAQSWAKILLFDMVIGNSNRTDRNWEIIHTEKGKKQFAPAFDNSISLLAGIGKKGIINWVRDNPFHRVLRALYFQNKARRFRLSIQPSLDAERFTCKRALVYIVQHGMLTAEEVIGILERLDIAKLSAWMARQQRSMNPVLAPAYRLDDRVATWVLAFLSHRRSYLLKQLASIQTGRF